MVRSIFPTRGYIGGIDWTLANERVANLECRSDLSVPERLEYIAAVKCLMKLPPKSPRDKFPGALNRFDDFVAFHMTQAGPLHGPVGWNTPADGITTDKSGGV